MKKISALAALGLLVGSGLTAQNFRVSGGTRYSVALTANGSVLTWGDNSSGQLARKTTKKTTVTESSGNLTIAYDDVPTPMVLKDAKGDAFSLIAVDAGSGGHAIAIGSDSTVWTWGENEHGQLGNGIANYGVHSAQCTDLTSVDWIGNEVSICNKGVPQHVVAGETAGKTGFEGVSGFPYTGRLKNVISISASASGSFAIVKDPVTKKTNLLAWGSNKNYANYCDATGQLGVGSSTPEGSSYPRYVLDKNGNPLTNVIAVDAGDNNCFAIVDDDNDGDATTGTVYGWGDGTNNKLNPTTTFNELSAMPVYIDAAGTIALTGVVKIAAGDGFMLASDKNGNLWSVGSEWCASGAALSPRANGKATWTNPKEAAKVVAGDLSSYNGGGKYLDNVKDIAAGQASGIAMVEATIAGKKSNYVMGWGSAYGSEDRAASGVCVNQLGNKTNTGSLLPGFAYRTNWRTGEIELMDSVVSVSDGDGMTYAVRDEKNESGQTVAQLYVTGTNGAGQLGFDPTNVKGTCVFTKLDLNGNKVSSPLTSGLISTGLNDTINKFWVTQQIVGPTLKSLNLITDSAVMMKNTWFNGTDYKVTSIVDEGASAMKVKFAHPQVFGSYYSEFNYKWYSFKGNSKIANNPFGYTSTVSSSGDISYTENDIVDTMYTAMVDLEKNPVVKLIAKSDKKVNIRVDLIDANGRTSNVTQTHHWLQGGNVVDTLEFRWDYKSLKDDGYVNYAFEDTTSNDYDVAIAGDGFSGQFLGITARYAPSGVLKNRVSWPGTVLLDMKKIVGLRIFFDDGNSLTKYNLDSNKTVLIKQITVGGDGVPQDVVNYSLENLISKDTTPKITFKTKNISINQYSLKDLKSLVLSRYVEKVNFKTDNELFGTIDQNGVFTANAVGETQVIAYSSQNTKLADTIKITIVKASNLSFILPRFVIFENETIDLSACVKATQGTNFDLSVANSDIAGLDTETGKLTGHKYGTTKVFATNRAVAQEKDSASILVLPNIIIVGVKAVGSGTMLEVYVNGDCPLYEGIENDFTLNVTDKLKSDGKYLVTSVMKSTSKSNTLLLQLNQSINESQSVTLNYAPQAAAKTHSSFTMNMATAVSQNVSEDIQVYPNPAYESVSVIASNLVQIAVYNNLGALVKMHSAHGNEAVVSLANLAEGVYVVEVITTERTIKKTIIKR